MKTKSAIGRLTDKQRDFISACDGRYADGFTKDGKPNLIEMPYFFGPLQWDEWGFWSRSAAEQFVCRMVQRGLIRTDKEGFYLATDLGRAAITPN